MSLPMSHEQAMTLPLAERVGLAHTIYGDMGGFPGDMWSRVKLVDVVEGKVTMRFVVTEADCNVNRILHGGAISTLVDSSATMAIYSSPRPWLYGGTSADLAITFTSAAPLGAEIEITSHLQRIGAYSAQTYTEIRLLKPPSNPLVAFSSHTKINTDSKFVPAKAKL